MIFNFGRNVNKKNSFYYIDNYRKLNLKFYLKIDQNQTKITHLFKTILSQGNKFDFENDFTKHKINELFNTLKGKIIKVKMNIKNRSK